MAQTSGGLLNWAGSHTFRAARVHRPETVAEVQAIVRLCREARVPIHAFKKTAQCEDIAPMRRRTGRG